MIRSSLTLLLALSGVALADVVHLTDGRKLEGTVTAEGQTVVVRQRWGEVRIPREEVLRVEETHDAWDELARQKRELGQGTADERYRFAEWCRAQGFKEEAQLAFLDVLRVDPDHPGARAALGYVIHEGRWITLADKNRAAGLVEHEGEWITPAERTRRIEAKREARDKAREAQLAAREAERERRKREREEAAAERKARIKEAELELAKAREERAKAEAELAASGRRPTRFYYGPNGSLYPVGYYPFGYNIGGIRVVTTGGGVYYGGCYPYPVYGGYSGFGYSSGVSGYYNGGKWGIRFRAGF